ncbi:MAG: stage III sporulation protein AG [Clostridiales bacterium GWB2_37_7]|nr:MAG: stage III sporulation protein AG [Clostridiales bacterium GWB2_37_7]
MDLFSKLKEQLKQFNLKKLNLNSKLAINLIVILAVGIGFILVSDFYKDLNLGGALLPDDTQTNIAEMQNDSSKSEYVSELEKRLTDILTEIQDAGKVSVMITLKTGTEIIPAKDESITDKTTDEKDVEGGTRNINEKNTTDQVVFMNDQGGTSKPLVLKEINPDIKGVIIVAEGAKDPKVKLQLTEAVQTVLDVPAYRVSVFESNK